MLGWASDRLGFRAITPVFDGADEVEIDAELARAWMIDQSWRDYTTRAWTVKEQSTEEQEEFEDDDEVRSLYLRLCWRARIRSRSGDDRTSVCSSRWCCASGCARTVRPDQITVFENDGARTRC